MNFTDWMEAAKDAVRWVADQCGTGFTSDEVWARLDDLGISLPEDPRRPGQQITPRRLAEAFQAIAREGLIVKTTDMRSSSRASRNQGLVAVWCAKGMTWARYEAVAIPGRLRLQLERLAEHSGMPLFEMAEKIIELGLTEHERSQR